MPNLRRLTVVGEGRAETAEELLKLPMLELHAFCDALSNYDPHALTMLVRTIIGAFYARCLAAKVDPEEAKATIQRLVNDALTGLDKADKRRRGVS